MEIRPLHEGDDRSQFQSGDSDLDRFFQKFAGQNQFRHYLGVSYVAVADRHGFVPVEATEGESGIRPRPTPMFLSTRAIERALNST